MSKTAKGKPRTPYIPPIRFARLQAMMMALRSGKELSARTRAEIALALELLRVKLIVDSDKHEKGGREATTTRGVALAMHWLIEHKHAGHQDAASTVLSAEFPNATVEDVDTACRMYREMRKAGEFDAVMHKLDNTYMEKLAKLLPKPRTGKE